MENSTPLETNGLLEYRRAHGMCEHCGQIKPVPGLPWCWICLGLRRPPEPVPKCHQCHGPNDRDKWICSRCVPKAAARMKRWRDKRKAAGKCIDCGKKSARSRCDLCREARRVK